MLLLVPFSSPIWDIFLCNLYMSCKMTCCYCTLAIIFVVIVSCLWLDKLIGIISIGNEYQLLWENKKVFIFHITNERQLTSPRARKVNPILKCGVGQPRLRFAGQNAGQDKMGQAGHFAIHIHNLLFALSPTPKRLP